MTGVIYCRVSSREQIEGTSLEVQETACREYARVKGIEIVRAFIEQGESAKFADRTQLVELIDFCRDHKGSVNALLVWKVDRFARNVADHFSVKATLGKYGVSIVSVTEPIDAKPEGRLMETILAGFAQFDNDIRAVRTVQGMRRKIQEGIFPWGPPFGYKSSSANGDKKNVADVPDQPTFGLLQKAWKDFAIGAYTQAEIGRRMQSWGLGGPRSFAFTPQFLSQLFTNRYYAGILIDPWSGDEYEGKHVPMVTREEFTKVQRVLARRTPVISHQKERPEFPVRGLVRCAGCLHYMTGGFSRGRSDRYPYYRCKVKSCPSRTKSYPASPIHEEFEEFLRDVTPKDKTLRDLGDQLITSIEKRRSGLDGLRTRRSDRMTSLRREHDELIRMRAQGLITDQEFLRQKKLILDRRDEIESRIAQAVNLDEVRTQFQAIVAPLVRLPETREALIPEFRRRFDRILLPAGFVIGKSRTAELGLVFSTKTPSADQNSLGVPPTSAKLNHVISEIQELWKVLNGIEDPKPEPKRRFNHSHRNIPRFRRLNPKSGFGSP